MTSMGISRLQQTKGPLAALIESSKQSAKIAEMVIRNQNKVSHTNEFARTGQNAEIRDSKLFFKGQMP